jgi:hypothetical protein
MHRRAFILMAAAAAVAAGGFPALRPARAGKDPVYTGFLSSAGAGGYDVVAYFTEGRPVKGGARFTAEHLGASWHFANAANRDAFVADPQAYLPRYGGYCAWAVANGYTASGDPEAWSVVDGRLYLNYSKSVRSTWEKDVPGNIARGDANWPKVLD